MRSRSVRCLEVAKRSNPLLGEDDVRRVVTVMSRRQRADQEVTDEELDHELTRRRERILR